MTEAEQGSGASTRLGTRRSRGVVVSAVAAAAVFGLGATDVQAKATVQAVSEERLPVAFTVTADCLTEPIALTAIAEIRRFAVVDDAGGLHAFRHTRFVESTAIGVISGKTYRVIRTSGLETSLGALSDQQEFTLFGNFQLLGPGGTQDLHSKLLIHMTTNANGEPTATVIHVETRCTG